MTKRKGKEITDKDIDEAIAAEDAPPVPQIEEGSLQVIMSADDYDALMSLLSFGLKTFSAAISEEAKATDNKIPEKYERSLKKYVDIFQKLDDAGNPDLGEDRILH